MFSINKNSALFVFTLFILASFELSAQSHSPAPNQLVAEFGPTWERAKEYTLEVVEAMPEEHYGYSPQEDLLPFREHIGHIITNLYRLNGRYVQELDEIPYDFAEVDGLSKAELIERLNTVFDFVTQSMEALNDEQLQDTIKFWSPSPTQRQLIFSLIRDHMTHHRGMMIVYLRMQGITPPKYRGW